MKALAKWDRNFFLFIEVKNRFSKLNFNTFGNGQFLHPCSSRICGVSSGILSITEISQLKCEPPVLVRHISSLAFFDEISEPLTNKKLHFYQLRSRDFLKLRRIFCLSYIKTAAVVKRRRQL